MLGLVLNLTTAEESLGVALLIKDDTEASGHVADITRGVVIDVHPRVLASVAIDVFKLISFIRLILVHFRMVIGLDSGSSLPWLHREELLTFLDLLSLELEEVRLRFVLVINGFKLASLLVELHALFLHVGRNITPVFSGGFAFSRVAGSHFW